MAHTTFAFNIDFTNTAQASAFGQIAAIAAASGIAFAPVTSVASAAAPVSVPTAPTPAPVERELEAPEDTWIEVTEVKAPRGKVAIRLGFGAGRAGAKLLIKDAGFTWDASLASEGNHGAFVAPKKALDGLTLEADRDFGTGKNAHKGIGLLIPAAWVQNGRDHASAKAARKAAKAS